MNRQIELHVGGKRIPLNLFAKEIITNVMLGVVGSLKGAAPEREITLHIGPADAAGRAEAGPQETND
jgi:hypothetical protein